ncbi:Diflavin flavoprotein A 1 [Frankliniella fusca]|uniref:Diflavin flavoprotein A 1 n=1 Tax=Frankliniella fusca TaxID=407009 RepID=A0AAE1I597_9NEOP|nr:Diflavin flavoprotein A 1 [Frankliniella fusca]
MWMTYPFLSHLNPSTFHEMHVAHIALLAPGLLAYATFVGLQQETMATDCFCHQFNKLIESVNEVAISLPNGHSLKFAVTPTWHQISV